MTAKETTSLPSEWGISYWTAMLKNWSSTVKEEKADMAEEAAVKKKEEFNNVQLVRRDPEIVIPEKMAISEAITWLTRKAQEEEQVVAISEVVDVLPLEGAFALTRAMDEKYGFYASVNTPGMFGPTPPTMISLEVAYNRTVQVAWGRFEIPKMEGGFLQSGLTVTDGRLQFVVAGKVKQKFKGEVNALCERMRELVKFNSIYKGKAFKVRFQDLEQETPDVNLMPHFLDTTKTVSTELIFSEELRQIIDTALMVPVMRTDECRAYGIPRKRGVLLEGPYGTGKTLTAHVLAKACEENQWTFIYLEDVKQLKTAIHYAKKYGPAVVFAEDLDRVMTGDRDAFMDSILNTIDGIDTKTAEVMVVLTTNHIKQINPAMLRPGRLDTVISVKPPNASAAQALIRLYARGLLQEGEDLSAVSEKLSGQIPAVIREVVERSKLAAIGRVGRGEVLKLSAGDLEIAANSMISHLALLQPREPDKRHPTIIAAEIIGHSMIGKVHATNGHGTTPELS